MATARKRAMIGVMNFSDTGFNDKRSNSFRIRAAKELLGIAHNKGFHALVFPAGYLISPTESTIKTIASPILRMARKLRMSTIVGVDIAAILGYPDDSNSPRMLRAIRRGKMPCFLVIYDAGTDSVNIMRQRSATNRQAYERMVPDDIMTPRIMEINGVSVNIIQCGEITDWRLFAEDAPRTAIVTVHQRMARLYRSMQGRSRMGFSLIQSEHRKTRFSLSFLLRKGKDASHRHRGQIDFEGNLWAEVVGFEIEESGRITGKESLI